MKEFIGKYNIAKVFTDNVEETAVGQIIDLCCQPFTKGSKIRIMPDTHAGAGCTIGTTMTIQDKLVPNMVGVDIGCGMECVKIENKGIDYRDLDETIRKYIPSGFNIRNIAHEFTKECRIKDLKCFSILPKKSVDRAILSIGTLGGGNHFIEVDKDSSDNLYIVVHSGSRNLGIQVAKYYQDLGYQSLLNNKVDNEELIAILKAQGREKDISSEIKKTKKSIVDKQLAYVEGQNFKDYLHDMKIVQEYAMWNRKAMMSEIIDEMGMVVIDQFTTIHNYIDVENMILRKGAISAQKNEKVLIPINMRDGSLICLGKGNPDWNYSAPHGAGRLMSRTKAKENVTLEEFQESMEGIYTTSVSEATIDESPMAYKPMQEIIDNIKDTVDILEIIKPTYNFKAGN
jgi:tRNA-splicing ligase RtcB